MNLLIYLVLTVIILMTLGAPKTEPTTQIGSIVPCVVPAGSADANRNTCPANATPAPAFKKLEPGDRVLSVDGTAISSWDQLVSLIEPSANKTLSVVLERDGARRTVQITPLSNRKYVGSSRTKTKVAGYLGVSPVERRFYGDVGITEVPGQIGHQVNLGLQALAKYPEKVGNLFGTVFQGDKRDPQGAVGVVGIGRISGDVAQSSLLTTKDKLYTLVSLLASVNLLLFFFNLLPLLPLDGGHVAGAIAEAVKRGRARLRAHREPMITGPDGVPVPRPHKPIFVDTASMLPVMYGVASVLVVLTLLTLYADIVDPIRILGG